jgi:AraC family transcriptional regulator
MDEGFWMGWNVKYSKSGKALCTLYPKQGHFIALVNIGAKESVEADLMIPLCDEYTQELYRDTKSGKQGKSLALEITNDSVLCDLKELIALRAASR